MYAANAAALYVCNYSLCWYNAVYLLLILIGSFIYKPTIHATNVNGY